MGILFFLLGLCFFLLGSAALAYDVLYYLETDLIDPASVSILWSILLGEQSMLDAQQWLRTTLGNANWASYGQPFMESPAFATPMALALLFWLFALMGRKPKIQQEEFESLATSGSGGERRRGGGRRS
jgi:hypothetical protein